MFRNRSAQVVGALLLIAFGIIALLNTMGIVRSLDVYLWAGLLAAGGLLFLVAFAGAPREQWWAIIPAAALLGVALLIYLGTLGTEWATWVSPNVLFVFLAGAFVVVFLLDRRRNWWALIPAGAMLSLVAVIVAGMAGNGALSGSALFLGMAVTFGVLYLLRGPQLPTQWAWIPSLALFAFGIFVFLVAGGAAQYAGAILGGLLVLVGGAVVLQVLLRGRR